LKDFSIEVKKQSDKLSHLSNDVKTNFSLPRGYRYELFQLRSLDPNSAANIANEVIEHVRALSFLNPSASRVEWTDEFFVSKRRQRSGAIYWLPENPISWLSPQTTAKPNILKDIRRYSNRILASFDDDSIERILKSVSTAAAARHSSSVESQLISLWAAVEGLISEPIDDMPRIEYFVSQILPCICRRHLHRRSVDLYEGLNSEYWRQFRRIVADELDFANLNPHSRFTAVFMFDGNKPIRKRLLKLASDNPLALHRMFQFYRDCRSPKALLKALRSQENRVE
jgi:hypothetical protein